MKLPLLLLFVALVLVSVLSKSAEVSKVRDAINKSEKKASASVTKLANKITSFKRKQIKLTSKVEKRRVALQNKKDILEKLKQGDASKQSPEQRKKHAKALKSLNKSEKAYEKSVALEKALKLKLDKYTQDHKNAEASLEARLNKIKNAKVEIEKLTNHEQIVNNLFKKWQYVVGQTKKGVRKYKKVGTKRSSPLHGKNCLCPVVNRPVCSADGTTYSSKCVAKCFRAKVIYNGKCDCSLETPTTAAPTTTVAPTTTTAAPKPTTTTAAPTTTTVSPTTTTAAPTTTTAAPTTTTAAPTTTTAAPTTTTAAPTTSAPASTEPASTEGPPVVIG